MPEHLDASALKDRSAIITGKVEMFIQVGGPSDQYKELHLASD
jgi:hypothetical protein